MFDDNQDFYRRVQDVEQQMFEHEMRIQHFKSAVSEVMEAEAKGNQALSSALQEAMRQIDIAIEKLGVKS
jgi:hypothetical protein